ncbi:hypothetical protein TrispH2_011568, partial [Trichoplax sp. H2]
GLKDGSANLAEVVQMTVAVITTLDPAGIPLGVASANNYFDMLETDEIISQNFRLFSSYRCRSFAVNDFLSAIGLKN